MEAVKVHRWLSQTVKKTYVITPDVMPIFRDDTVDKALTKIALVINSLDATVKLDTQPFAWWKNRGLRFVVSSKFTTPFDYSPQQMKSITYTNSDLFDLSEVNVMFMSDVSPKLQYLFPDKDSGWKPDTLADLKEESTKLYAIWNLGKIPENERIEFLLSRSQFSATTAPINITEVFESTHTSQNIPFLQLVQDGAHITYKLFSEHSVPYTSLQQWCTYVPKTRTKPTEALLIAMICINVNHNTFVRVAIEGSGQIHVQYKIDDTTNTYSLESIRKHVSIIEAWLHQILHIKVHLQQDTMNIRTQFDSQIAEADYYKVLSKQFWIFNMLNKDKATNTITLAFKRSVHNANMDISDYIASRQTIGLSLDAIIHELIELGLSASEAAGWVAPFGPGGDILQQQQQQKKKITSLSTGCVANVLIKKYRVQLRIDNTTSVDEARSLLQWLRGVIFQAKTVRPKSAAAAAAEPVKLVRKPKALMKAKAAPAAAAAAVAAAAELPSESSPSSENLLNKEIDLFGGTNKKDKDELLHELKLADPALFGNQYATKCQYSSARQPTVMTKEDLKNIEAQGYGDNVKDKILYGSDNSHQNYYTCPKIWCPMAKIPLTPKQLEDNGGVCPGPYKEVPRTPYLNNYWARQKKQQIYIGFYGKDRDPHCLPCCMGSEMKETDKAQCLNPDYKGATENGNNKKPKNKKKKADGDVNENGDEDDDNQTQAQAQGQGDGTNGNVVVDFKKVNYLIAPQGPLLENRYGVIPQDLHHFLYPDIAFSQCNHSLTMKECVVRHGLGNGGLVKGKPQRDSFMESIAYCLGMPSKQALIEFMFKTIDPVTYMSLDDGHILSSFMERTPFVGKSDANAALLKEWKVWLTNHNKYERMLMIDLHDDIKVSRELAIYASYKNFMRHLASNDVKNPHHMVGWLQTQDILLVIWNRNSETSVSAMCPLYSNISELAFDIRKHAKVMMLLHDPATKYFEPLEIKQRSKTGTPLISDTNPLNKTVVQFMRKSCLSKTSHQFVELMASFHAWIKLRLFNSGGFIIIGMILRPDGKIYGLMTVNKLLITFPTEGVPMRLIPALVNRLSIKRIMYLDDIAGQSVTTKDMYQNDYTMFKQKIVKLGMGLMSGVMTNTGISTLITGTYFMPSIENVLPLVPVRNEDSIYQFQENQNAENKRWFQLQHYVGGELLKYYESLVVPLLKYGRKKRILTLMNTFKKNPHKEKVQVILEEIPLEDGKEAVARWIRSIGLEERARLYTSTEVHDVPSRKEWIFSQAAVENGLPMHVFVPVHGFVSNDVLSDSVKNIQATKSALSLSAASPEKHKQMNKDTLPSLLVSKTNSGEGANAKTKEWKSLPIKWGKSWTHYKILNKAEYKATDLPDLLKWVSDYTELPLDWEDVRDSRSRILTGLFIEKKDAMHILEEPSLFNAWNMYFKKKHKNPEVMWNSDMGAVDSHVRVLKWKDLLATEKTANEIWPMDIDLEICTKLLSIGILVLYRTEYGATTKVKGIKRGDLDDLVISSTFYRPEVDYMNRPCIILYRDREKQYTRFNAIINQEDGTFIHPLVADMPTDILRLIQRHVEDSA